MKKLLLLVLTLTASASPSFQDKKLPFRDQPIDHVMKEVVKKEPIVQNTEEEQGPLMQDEPVADVLKPDSVLLEPETTEEHRIREETSVMVEEPVLEADLTPQTELEPEPEVAAIEMNGNNIPAEEPVLEADYLTEETPETELDPEPEIVAIQMKRKIKPVEEPVLEADYLTPQTELEPEPEIAANEMNRNNIPVEEAVLEADYLTGETPETELEPELERVAIQMNRKNIPVQEPVLEADYLTEETPETELEAEPETIHIEMNRNNILAEEPVVEMESVDETVVKSEKDQNLSEEPTVEGDYIVVEDPEEIMEPVRERRMTLKTGRWSCRGVVLQGKCYQLFRRNLDANTAELQCQDICPNGHLASVTSSYIREEMGKLMDLYGGRTSAWVGGWREISTRNFRWLDGAQWSYNNWAFGEPINAGGMKNCVEILSSLAFNDVPCEIPKPFICSCSL